MLTKLQRGLFTFIYVARCLSSAQTLGNMTSSPGINSVVYITVPSDEVAKKIARGLVQEKLAACVNIIPQLTSVYEWEGKINEDSELLLMIKTRSDTINLMNEYVRKHHPYSVYELISLPIQDGNPKYLDWIGSVVPPVTERKKEETAAS